MILILTTIATTFIGLPLCIVSSIIAKLSYFITGKKQIDTSRQSFFNEIREYIKLSSNVFEYTFMTPSSNSSFPMYRRRTFQ